MENQPDDTQFLDNSNRVDGDLNPSTMQSNDSREQNNEEEEEEEPVIVKVECYRWVILMSYIGLNGVISLG